MINTTALREHAAKGWSELCLVPKATVLLIANELDELRAVNSASLVAAALESCDRSGVSIGNKALIQQAINLLRVAPK